MTIKIDTKTRIQVSPDYFALMRPGGKGEPPWKEIKWFSSLENCIQYLVQRNLSGDKSVVSLEKFLSAYRGELSKIRDIRSKNIL